MNIPSCLFYLQKNKILLVVDKSQCALLRTLFNALFTFALGIKLYVPTESMIYCHNYTLSYVSIFMTLNLRIESIVTVNKGES